MELRTEIEIDASPGAVWAVLTDFRSYGEWNPFIPQATGNLRAGERIEAVLCPPGGNEITIRPTLLVVDPEKELRWKGQLFVPRLFDGEHFFRLVELAPKRTRFVHGEDFSGILVRPLRGLITKTARGFVFMNQALKRRVEDGG